MHTLDCLLKLAAKKLNCVRPLEIYYMFIYGVWILCTSFPHFSHVFIYLSIYLILFYFILCLLVGNWFMSACFHFVRLKRTSFCPHHHACQWVEQISDVSVVIVCGLLVHLTTWLNFSCLYPITTCALLTSWTSATRVAYCFTWKMMPFFPKKKNLVKFDQRFELRARQRTIFILHCPQMLCLNIQIQRRKQKCLDSVRVQVTGWHMTSAWYKKSIYVMLS